MVHLLFLGAKSGCRSHMAEGFAARLAPPDVHVDSADIEPRHMHPHTVTVMREVGIEIVAKENGGLAAPPGNPPDPRVSASRSRTGNPKVAGPRTSAPARSH